MYQNAQLYLLSNKYNLRNDTPIRLKWLKHERDVNQWKQYGYAELGMSLSEVILLYYATKCL